MGNLDISDNLNDLIRAALKELHYVQRHVCFVNAPSSLHENVIFSVCSHMGNAAYIIFIMWKSISGLEGWYHFWFNISCGMAVIVRSHQKKIQVILGRGRKTFLIGRANF